MIPAGRCFNPGWGRVSTAWHFFRIQTQVRSSRASRSTRARAPLPHVPEAWDAGSTSVVIKFCVVHAWEE